MNSFIVFFFMSVLSVVSHANMQPNGGGDFLKREYSLIKPYGGGISRDHTFSNLKIINSTEF